VFFFLKKDDSDYLRRDQFVLQLQDRLENHGLAHGTLQGWLYYISGVIISVKMKLSEGIYLVEKKRGDTTFSLVRHYKKLFPGEKVGHAGTLDPLAEGLVIILVGKATKKQPDFLNLDKEYWVEAVFGLKSETYDLEGELKYGFDEKGICGLADLTKERVGKCVEKLGKGYEQTVPFYSAVKVKGQPLYRLARRKRTMLTLPSRFVAIRRIEIVSFSGGKAKDAKTTIAKGDPKESLKYFPKVEFKMTVGKGFFVRSLINDIGDGLGVGAVVTKLIRRKIGPYTLEKDIKKEDSRTNAGR